ncbi:hypothetical protein Q8A73_008276 [Channa argus]|nr:hypothetical protein Q8A73_008276 [Channa argus]
MWLGVFPDSRTAAPHAPRLVSKPPTPSQASPPASPTASHRAGQEPSEEPGKMRGDGQAVSGVDSHTLSGQCHGQPARCDIKQEKKEMRLKRLNVHGPPPPQSIGKASMMSTTSTSADLHVPPCAHHFVRFVLTFIFQLSDRPY